MSNELGYQHRPGRRSCTSNDAGNCDPHKFLNKRCLILIDVLLNPYDYKNQFHTITKINEVTFHF